MLLSQLEYFVSLAREQHFGRAAAACFVSQSALSESIRKLELELGTPLINRGRTFDSLTPEGDRVLVWARRIVADHRALRDEFADDAPERSGELRLGVIPSAIPGAARIVSRLTAARPNAHTRIITGLTSEAVLQQLQAYELDAGLIHPSETPAAGIVALPMYEEHLVVVTSPGLAGAEATEITAAAAATLPLCLLTPGMRARQILDRRLAEHAVRLRPAIEVDSVEELLALVRSGPWATVVPLSAAPVSGDDDLRVLDLVDPDVTLPISLAFRAEEPKPPIIRALLRAVEL